MKIINLTQFRAMPEGTVFMKYEPCVFEPLSVKGETWEFDFISASITDEVDADSSEEMENKLRYAENSGESIDMDFEGYIRDGCFEPNQLFAVYEKKDIEGLINKLNSCLSMSEEKE